METAAFRKRKPSRESANANALTALPGLNAKGQDTHKHYALYYAAHRPDPMALNTLKAHQRGPA